MQNSQVKKNQIELNQKSIRQDQLESSKSSNSVQQNQRFLNNKLQKNISIQNEHQKSGTNQQDQKQNKQNDYMQQQNNSKIKNNQSKPKQQQQPKYNLANNNYTQQLGEERLMLWQVFYIKDEFEIHRKQAYTNLQQIQEQIKTQRSKLEILLKQNGQIDENRSFQQNLDISEIRKSGYQTQINENDINYKGNRVLQELQIEEEKKFSKPPKPLIKITGEGQKQKIEQFKQQLKKKRKQLKQVSQKKKAKQIMGKITQLQNRIRVMQQKYNESKKQQQQKKQQKMDSFIKRKIKNYQINYVQNKNTNHQSQPKKQQKISMDNQNNQRISHSIKTENQKISQNIQSQKDIDNHIQQADNLNDSDVFSNPSLKQQQIQQKNKQVKYSKNMKIQSNIYNLALGELILLEYQRGQNQSIKNQLYQSTKQKKEVQNKQVQCNLQDKQNVQIISNLKNQKLKLEQQIKNLRKRVQQLEMHRTLPIQQYNSQYINPTPKSKDLILHYANKQVQQKNHNNPSKDIQEAQIINIEQKKFKKSLRPSSKKLQKKNNQQKNQSNQYQSRATMRQQLHEQGLLQKKKQSKMFVPKTEPPIKIGLKNMEFPKLPGIPIPTQSSKQLIELGKRTFQLFGVRITQSHVFNIKKFKNCVYFNLNNCHIVWYYNGKFYIGGWKNNQGGQGQKQGFGIQYIPQKYIYEGNFKQGRRNGTGTMKYQNGDIYNGQWLDGLRNGNGRWEQANGLIYQGQWKQGKKQGFGKQTVGPNQVYEGMFFRNIKNGYGKQIFKNGDSYHGEYMMGKFSGKGCYKWTNGAFYDGQFYNGCRNGHGSWRSSQITPCDLYQGQYINDKKCGKGKYIWQNGSSYQGEFLNDLKHGEGTLRFLGGKILRAIWQNGVAKKKLYSEEQQIFKQTKKPPRIFSAVKNQQMESMSGRKYRIHSNKNGLKIEEKNSKQTLKQSPYKKMQHNSMLQVGDI